MSASPVAAAPRRLTVRRGSFSVRADGRVVASTLALLVVVFAVFVVNVALGELAIAPLDVLSALVGQADASTSFIVTDLRLPRALTGLLAGFALGMAGALFQDVTRNPLASPDVLGVAGGASLAAVSLIVFVGSASAGWVPIAALGGALAAGSMLYALAWKSGVQGFRLVLVGIGVAAFCQAGVSWVLTEGRIFEVATAYVWLVGSLNGRGWEHVWPLVIALAAMLPVLGVLGRRIDVLLLGDEVARSLGVRVERTRLMLLAVAIGLTGIAVSSLGAIQFVAFIAPHIARRVAGSVGGQGLLLAAGACGAVLVQVADIVGRMVFSPTEIPVGILTSIIAAPYFLLVLRRARRLGVGT